jgi:hypothetical protein
MKNPASYIRQQLRVLLHETITYDSVDVPCYEGQGEVEKYQILLQSAFNQERGYRDAFVDHFEQVIEVVSEQDTSLHKHVDQIAGEVMDKIQPTTNTHGLSSNNDFQIGRAKLLSQNYRDEPSGEGTFINRLILRYQFIIVEK